IDIEGCDDVCLEALKNFEERPNFISIESDKKSFAHVVKEINTLEELGYRRFAAVQQTTVGRQSMPATQCEGKSVSHEFVRGSSGLFGGELPVPWQSSHDVLQKYRRVFLWYRLLGDDSLFARY